MLVLHCLFTTTSLARETKSCREDRLAPLSGLHSARGKATTLSHVLHMVDDGDLAVAVEHKVAVHGVDVEVLGHGSLRSRQTLRDHGAAIDASRAWRVPEGTGVGEEVRVDVGEVREFEYGFDGRGGGVWWWWGYEGCVAGHFGGLVWFFGIRVGRHKARKRKTASGIDYVWVESVI